MPPKTLADMGAKVIRVERYSDGSNERWLPYRTTHNGVTQSSYSINVNRGKRSICIKFRKNQRACRSSATLSAKAMC